MKDIKNINITKSQRGAVPLVALWIAITLVTGFTVTALILKGADSVDEITRQIGLFMRWTLVCATIIGGLYLLTSKKSAPELLQDLKNFFKNPARLPEGRKALTEPREVAKK